MRVGDAELRGERASSASISRKRVLSQPDEIRILLTRADEVPDPEQRGERRVPARPLDDPVPRVDQDHREMRGRGAGDHVARVALVAWRVGDDD